MNEIITSETQILLNKLLNPLQCFYLAEISFKSAMFSISLTFAFKPDGNGKDIVIEMFEIVHFILSKEPDDNEPCYSVFELTLNTLTDGGLEVLSSLQYPFWNPDKSTIVDPSRQLFYWHLEGDIILEVICRKYQIFQVED